MSLEDNVMKAVDAARDSAISAIGASDRLWEEFLDSTNTDPDNPDAESLFGSWLDFQKDLAAEYRAEQVAWEEERGYDY